MDSFKNELRKTFRETVTYYPDFIVNVIVDIILFFIMFKYTSNVVGTITSFVLWILVSGVMSEASITISTEKQLGTLQNLLLKPTSILHTLINKTLSWMLINLTKMIIVLSFVAIFYDISEIFDLRILIIFVITLIGILGFSLLLAVLTLIYTKVASFETIFSYLLLYLSGTFVDVPKFVIYTNPLSYATFLIKNINSIDFTNYIILIAISIIWFLVGSFLFDIIFKKSKTFNWTY